MPWLDSWLDPKNWLIAGLTTFLCVLLWVMVHQLSPPVVDACGKVVAPAFNRSAKP